MACFKVGVKKGDAWKYYTYLGAEEGLLEELSDWLLTADKVTITRKR